MKRVACQILVSLPLLLTGCEAELERDVLGIQHEAVVNGQAHKGHASAGKLIVGNQLCTATLIGRRTVLTAAHCIEPGYTHTFVLDSGAKFASTRTMRHPQYNSYTTTNDIGLVLLQGAPGASASAIATSPPRSGQKITIIGYGKTNEYANDVGVKRMAVSIVSGLSSTQLRIPASTSGDMGNLCNGDSGGPSFATVGGMELQIGVHSTKAGSCGAGGTDTRVDAFVDWIIAEAGGDVNTDGTTPSPAPGASDKQPPTVTIESPAAGARVGSSITVKVKVSDNKGVTKTALLVDGKIVTSKVGPTNELAAVVAAGSHTLQVIAEDAAGNRGQASVVVTASSGAGAEPTPGPNGPDDPGSTPAPGEFGATCEAQSDCRSQLCADDKTLAKRYCTLTCGTNTPCPKGSTCYESEAGGVHVCGLDAASGAPSGTAPGSSLDAEELMGSCSVATGNHSPPVWWAVLLLAWFVSRRRAPR